MKALNDTSFYRITVVALLIYLAYNVGRLLFLIESHFI